MHKQLLAISVFTRLLRK